MQILLTEQPTSLMTVRTYDQLSDQIKASITSSHITIIQPQC